MTDVGCKIAVCWEMFRVNSRRLLVACLAARSTASSLPGMPHFHGAQIKTTRRANEV